MKMLFYCTKIKPYLLRIHKDQVGFMCNYKQWLIENQESYKKYAFNGKIIGECEFEVEEIFYQDGTLDQAELGILGLRTKSLCEEDLLSKSCLSYKQLNEYLRDSSPNGYAIHIKNLTIFDEPKELSDYYSCVGFKGDINNYHSIEKAPQNMMYAYELHSELGYSWTYNRWFEKKIVISIRPQWLCLIANRIKDVEVRKVILKEMINND